MAVGFAHAGDCIAADWQCGTGLTWCTLGVARAGLVQAVQWLSWQFRRAPATFGSARWLRKSEAARLNLLGQRGLIVGKFGGRLLRFPDVEGSVAVFAPQGTGKGVGVFVRRQSAQELFDLCRTYLGPDGPATGVAVGRDAPPEGPHDLGRVDVALFHHVEYSSS